MAVTHTHHHNTEIGESAHVDSTGRSFGADVHAGLAQGGGEHTHDDVWVVHDDLKDADLLVPEEPSEEANEEDEEEQRDERQALDAVEPEHQENE